MVWNYLLLAKIIHWFEYKFFNSTAKEFKMNLYKLSINSISRKTKKKIQKHSCVKLVNKWWGWCGIKNIWACLTSHNRTIFDKNLNPTENFFFFNKLIHISTIVLEFSERCVYAFHNNSMINDLPTDDINRYWQSYL